ncbi:hypothetical protein Tcan_15987 [Toxocara canis]|uniref:Uncharacterized protein n=1 Tax=Toxocara canis TaxID=6265 RepID=A0A0B2W395_TOXCA|nr:hypothetical protein Tcan_15987 [Toxocara canis]
MLATSESTFEALRQIRQKINIAKRQMASPNHNHTTYIDCSLVEPNTAETERRTIYDELLFLYTAECRRLTRSKHQQCSKLSEEHLSAYRAPPPVELQQQRQYHRPHIAKPKSIKVLTAYEQCKLECKRKRDQADTEEVDFVVQNYVQRLKDELAQAEAALAERTAIE